MTTIMANMLHDDMSDKTVCNNGKNSVNSPYKNKLLSLLTAFNLLRAIEKKVTTSSIIRVTFHS